MKQRAGWESPVQRAKWWSPELEELREETVRAQAALEERHRERWERECDPQNVRGDVLGGGAAANEAAGREAPRPPGARRPEREEEGGGGGAARPARAEAGAGWVREGARVCVMMGEREVWGRLGEAQTGGEKWAVGWEALPPRVWTEGEWDLPYPREGERGTKTTARASTGGPAPRKPGSA